MSYMLPPKALNMQISMILHQCTFKSAIRLSMLFFKMTTFTVWSRGEQIFGPIEPNFEPLEANSGLLEAHS
jgi:hypothetical protein